MGDGNARDGLGHRADGICDGRDDPGGLGIAAGCLRGLSRTHLADLDDRWRPRRGRNRQGGLPCGGIGGVRETNRQFRRWSFGQRPGQATVRKGQPARRQGRRVGGDQGKRPSSDDAGRTRLDVDGCPGQRGHVGRYEGYPQARGDGDRRGLGARGDRGAGAADRRHDRVGARRGGDAGKGRLGISVGHGGRQSRNTGDRVGGAPHVRRDVAIEGRTDADERLDPGQGDRRVDDLEGHPTRRLGAGGILRDEGTLARERSLREAEQHAVGIGDPRGQVGRSRQPGDRSLAVLRRHLQRERLAHHGGDAVVGRPALAEGDRARRRRRRGRQLAGRTRRSRDAGGRQAEIRLLRDRDDAREEGEGTGKQERAVQTGLRHLAGFQEQGNRISALCRA